MFKKGIFKVLFIFVFFITIIFFTLNINSADTEEKTSKEKLVGDIIFSVPSSTFQNQITVALSTSIANSEIRYTTNGQVPTINSELYKNELTFKTTTQLRAQCFVNGEASGNMGTSVYIACSTNVKHDLPLVLLDAYGSGKATREYSDVAIMVMDTNNSESSLLQTPSVATRGGYHLRGQSSANFEKAPYRLELWNNKDNDADYSLLGMAPEADWALLGPFPDKSLIRSAFAYEIGQAIGLYAPHYSFVELYLNQDKNPLAADDYQGVYLLVETIKQSSSRLDIAKLKKTDLNEPEISGGYIMQFNMMAAEEPLIKGTGWSDLEVSDPNDLVAEQLTWITNYIQKVQNSIHSTDPSNPTTGYPAYIDVDSFVNYIINNELARQGDSYLRSTYIYKDRDKKLTAGPLWDYDLGYDCFTGMMGFSMTEATRFEGWQYEPAMAGMGGSTVCDWYSTLMKDPNFQNKVKTRWKELRSSVLSDSQLTNLVTSLAKPLPNAAKRNFQKWNILKTATVGNFGTQTTDTWEQQIQILKDFLVKRTAWLDKQWGSSSQQIQTTILTNSPGISPSSSPNPSPSQTTATSISPAANNITISYSQNDWGNGATVSITINNNSSSAINNWTLSWTYSGNQKITNLWNGSYTQTGSNVTVQNAAFNSTIPAKGSVNFGFNISYSGSNAKPSSCTFNGTTYSIQ